MILKLLHTIKPLRELYYNNLGPKWVGKKIKPFESYLKGKHTILDIGSGNGLITEKLRKRNFQVTPLDISDQSFNKKVVPVVYDGKTIPFKDQEFDVGLILSVLHHTNNQEQILLEAKRVCASVVVNEDIYSNVLQKHLTILTDSFVNFLYSPCPRTNKSDAEWQSKFEELGFTLKEVKYQRVLLFFKQAIYHLQC